MKLADIRAELKKAIQTKPKKATKRISTKVEVELAREQWERCALCGGIVLKAQAIPIRSYSGLETAYVHEVCPDRSKQGKKSP